MRIINLEMYKWKYFQNIYLPSLKRHKYPHISNSMWWIEHGAFISTLPRQTGKTTMLVTLANNFVESGEKYLFIATNLKACDRIKHFFGLEAYTVVDLKNKKTPTIPMETNLLVDEYKILDHNDLHYLLSSNWKTVTMLSTEKL